MRVVLAIERAEFPCDVYIEIEEFFPAKGSLKEERYYKYEDNDISSGVAYCYKLNEVGFGGKILEVVKANSLSNK